jgi:hypothetical protein
LVAAVEAYMRSYFAGQIITIAIAVAGVSTVISVSIEPAWAQGSAVPDTVPSTLRTAWGEPDLQGIWTDETYTALQRPAVYADQEFFTEAQRAELDRLRAAIPGKSKRAEPGTELDVAGGYDDVFMSRKRTGARTSLIVDPPNGRIPSLTAEAQKLAAADREFLLALLQSTETCKNKLPACNGGNYDPTPSPRRLELPPRYNATNAAFINRHDGPEDGHLAQRCLNSGLPEFGSQTGSFRRIVQTPGGISMFYDYAQGQGFQRSIAMDGSPHLPASIRQWFGDSRGQWEGDTLVIEVTNFSPKTDFQGSRENLHLIERWRRTGPTTLEYEVTMEDPTVWTRPWTVKQEFTKQSDAQNRIYYEPRCIEGNYALPGMLHAARMEELAFAQGRGPDPATRDGGTGLSGAEDDPLQ